MKSLKVNIVLNFINTFSGIIFPLITFPYAARVLLPDGIGAVNFLNSIVNYIVLFTSLGIPLYAVREVAKYRDDKALRDKITVEISLLSIFLCIFGYIAVAILAEFVPQINGQIKLFYVLSLSIIFNAIGVNWFYQAVEDFTFITVRGIVVRTLCALSLFIFVKSPDDLLAYGWVTVGFTVGNNLLNFVHLFELISLKGIVFKGLNIMRHLSPALKIFLIYVITSIYLNLNILMLGLMQDDAAVGIFTAGNKMSHIVLYLVTSISAVLLPRCSNLIGTKKFDEFITLNKKTLRVVIAFSLPCVTGLMLLATPLVLIFCGQEFLTSNIVLILTAPVILIIGISSVLGIQVLYPMGKENLVIWSSVGGALANLILNLLLIPRHSYIGASIGTLAAESVVTVMQIIFVRKYLPSLFKNFNIMNYVVATALMAGGILILLHLLGGAGNLTIISCIIPAAILIYFAYLFIRKDQVLTLIKNKRLRNDKLENN